MKQQHHPVRSYGLSAEVFWERTCALVAKCFVALQPSLAHKYRAAFPAIKRRAPDGKFECDDEDEDDTDDDEEAGSSGAGRARRRAL